MAHGPLMDWTRLSPKNLLPDQVTFKGRYLALSLVTVGTVFLVCLSYSSNIPIHGDIRVFQVLEQQYKDCHFQFRSNQSVSRRNFHWNDTRLDLLNMEKIKFDQRFKNPCWYEPLEEENPYKNNAYSFISPWANRSFTEMIQIWRTRIADQKQPCRLRCLPYFLIIGQPKCGSTSLYWKIAKHPDVTPPPIKELHWWSRTRQGRRLYYRRLITGEDYVDMFDKAAYVIESYEDLTGGFAFPHVTGEASVSVFWDNNEWHHYPENYNRTEPLYINAHYINHILPDIKLILILRDPVTRLYSDYLYFHKNDKSRDHFHTAVTHAVGLYSSCISLMSARQCVYNTSLAYSVRVRLRVGLYSVYLRDWLAVFPRQQFYILRLEDYSKDIYSNLKQIYRFLELDDLTEEQKEVVLEDKNYNKRKKTDAELGNMYNKTRSLLKEFYKPYNEELSEILADDRFLWNDQIRGFSDIN